MDLFRSVLGGGASDASSNAPTSAETIERLVDRLMHGTLLEDRRDACRAVKAMSRKYRVEVGVQALDPMTQVLDMDRGDEEIISYALDTLCNVCSPEEFEEEVGTESAKDNINGIGEQFTEIYLKKSKNVQLVIDILEEFDFKIRRPAVKLLTHLLLNKPREMQEIILASHMGVSRLMDIMVDTREVLRNDALLLLIQLTKGNANLQKIVAFENAFDKLVDIIQVEGYSDGGIVVEDCLRLMLNLLRNNASNQTFFREGSYIQKVTPFFDLTLEEDEIEIGWSAQKVSNMLHMLQVIRTLVSPSTPTNVSTACQATILQCSLLEKMCSILMAAGIPADILTETINTISESIRGSKASQEFFSRVNAPSNPPKPALILLLMSMVNEKQPFALRCAVIYCFQCYLHKNPARQHEVMSTLLPSHQRDVALASDVSAGQLLCGGLFSSDRLSNWFSSVGLAHGLMDQENLKVELLRVQLSTNHGTEPISLLLQCCNILQQTSSVQTKLGNLMLISTWAANSPTAVGQLLAVSPLIPFLTSVIGSNEHDELERLVQGLCAFLLGLCLVYNDNSVKANNEEELFQLIEKRIGFEVYMDKLSEVSKHEAYNKALKHPQLKCSDSRDLIFDHKFCQHFKHLEHVVINFLTKRKENNADDVAETDPAVVMQYKELIREQDHRINDLSRTNIYFQQELSNTNQALEEMETAMQTLRDQNSLLRAQVNQTPVTTNGLIAFGDQQHQPPTMNGIGSSSDNKNESSVGGGGDQKKTEEEKKQLERELKIRDEIIHELEMRLADVKTPPLVPSSGGDLLSSGPTKIEVDMLNSQLQALQMTVANKEAELDRVQSELSDEKFKVIEQGDLMKAQVSKALEELKEVKSEQEDLLLMLADQDVKLRDYRARLRALGQVVEDEDDEE